MSQFSSNGKAFENGSPLAGFGSVTVDVTTAGTSLEQTAPPSLTGPDNKPLGFLFWDTGRRITNKRRVRWTFSHPDKWSDWRALAWYGIGGGEYQPLVLTSAYSVGVGPMAATPIDGTASSFVNGPGGSPLAWPWSGDDHWVRTEWGDSTIHAKSHMDSPGGLHLDFSSWIQLLFGGDESDYFAETDDDLSSLDSGSGVSGIAGVGSPDFPAAKGLNAVLIAGYVGQPPLDPNPLLGKLRDLIAGGLLGKYVEKGDPSPEDIVRLKLINEAIDLVRGERPTSTDAFEALIAAARIMSPQELKRTIVSTQATLRRGESAVRFMQSLATRQRANEPNKPLKPKKPGR